LGGYGTSTGNFDGWAPATFAPSPISDGALMAQAGLRHHQGAVLA